MQQHFGVGSGAEDMALFHQLVPYGLEVVDFPVKDQHLGAVLVEDGLGAPLQIDDGQAAEAERRPAVHVIIVLVRPPVADPVRHFPDDPLGVIGRRLPLH